MSQDQATERRDLDLEPGSLGLHVGNAEQDQRRRLTGHVLPVAFDRGNFHRLVLEGIEAVEIADHCLNRGDDQCHPHGHRQHLAHGRVVTPAQQVPGRRGTDEERGGHERGSGHVHQAVGEGGVEHHRKPVHRHHPTIDDLVTLRGLHPAVRGENPEGRDQRTERYHHRGEEVQTTADAVPAKQHDAQEAGFEEERSQYFVGEQRAGDGAGKVGEAAPVGAELVGHDQAGNHPHAEVDGEDFRPEVIKVTVDLVVGPQPEAFEDCQVARQANGDGREQDVERHGKGKLHSGEL
ncbi:hypothetical protein D3C79_557770 [compost metagenome]